jgi:tetratricopeptide (TPR) repeat protein
MWSEHTALMAFGATMWGINRAAWGFGYWGYENPYYTESYPIDGGYVIDYSQPIAIESAPVATPAPAGAPTLAMNDFDAARDAFYRGEYAAALVATNKALSALPNDPIIHEFRALVMFAQGKYQESASGLYSVLSVGPGWDWTTLSSLYPNVDVYTKHLRALEAYVKQRPQAMDGRFVLAYHYLTCGNQAHAARQLSELAKQRPQDMLVKQLLLMTGGAEASGASPPTPQAEKPAAPTIPATDLVGSWTASGQNKTTFAMQLTPDGGFTWTYTQNGKAETVKGVFAMDGNVLAMEPQSGGVMLAELTKPQGGRMEFRLLGAPPGDPGLRFEKKA